MSYRKKRLLIVQIILTTIAIILAYIFYYKGNYQNDLRTTSEISSHITNQEEAQENFFENVEYRGIDANGNRYLLKSDFATFEKDKPELIKMAGMNAIFYFKDGKELNVYGDKGTYNNKTNDMEFRENVKVTQAENIIYSDNLDYFNLKKIINIYGNVEGKSLDGNFSSDILVLNIAKQTLDISMYNENQVNVNLKKWKRDLE